MHAQFSQHAYHKWCKDNNLELKLPDDVKAHKTASAAANMRQGTLDKHVQEIEPEAHILPYTDKLFCEAAVKWLITTNQPIQAVDHPSFRKMIDIASQATKGVVIPNRKATQAEIINVFKKQMTWLRECLNVSATSLRHSVTDISWLE
ncbi:hypothetical protein PAXINDRAFT_89641 [Paxillus involutus ATCC 200175]|uniref:Uncharacterized protein n=1 Tax=Paxillus involutus ATCC 200175 TaxID=664439 RepID=A0A0C9SXU8_PAXIN|nr:hypothetical protein PAXINDRAFT_89641 [Paxillus involutus ATCC 200175]